MHRRLIPTRPRCPARRWKRPVARCPIRRPGTKSEGRGRFRQFPDLGQTIAIDEAGSDGPRRRPGGGKGLVLNIEAIGPFDHVTDAHRFVVSQVDGQLLGR